MKRLLPVFTFGCLIGSPAVLAQDPFIVFGPTTKVVFNQVEIDGFTVTQATASVAETEADGTLTVRRQTYAIVPDGSGGFTRQVTQEETVATPDPQNPGSFDVETTTEELETPVDATDTATGATETETTVVLEEDVDEDNLDLPPTTTFEPIDENLDQPIVVSPA